MLCYHQHDLSHMDGLPQSVGSVGWGTGWNGRGTMWTVRSIRRSRPGTRVHGRGTIDGMGGALREGEWEWDEEKYGDRTDV